jgi:CheY-like chemotaxis protein
LTGDRVHKADRAPEGKYSNSIKEAEEACATAESLARQLLTLSPTGGRRWMTRVAARKKGTPFAAAIMDLTPPTRGAGGGKEALRQLRELDSTALCIVSSGYANDPILSEWCEHGFAGVLPKPYRLEDVSEVPLRVSMVQLVG